MSPSIRKLALTAHITSAVGWLGAVVGFLAIAVAVLSSQNAQFVRGFYLSMNVIGWYVIVPLCLASLATGLVMSLGTKWGLFRHYWVLIKFLLTVISTLILFGFTQTLSYLGTLATDTTLSINELRNLSQSPVIHSGGGLLVLLVNTTLSIYKPWGKTRYGRREENEKSKGLSSDNVSSDGKPWKFYILVGLLSLIVLFLALHLILRTSA